MHDIIHSKRCRVTVPGTITHTMFPTHLRSKQNSPTKNNLFHNNTRSSSRWVPKLKISKSRNFETFYLYYSASSVDPFHPVQHPGLGSSPPKVGVATSECNSMTSCPCLPQCFSALEGGILNLVFKGTGLDEVDLCFVPSDSIVTPSSETLIYSRWPFRPYWTTIQCLIVSGETSIRTRNSNCSKFDVFRNTKVTFRAHSTTTLAR